MESNKIDEAMLEHSNIDGSLCWTCWYEGKYIGVVEASSEQEAYEKMEATWPELHYGKYDGVAQVTLEEDLENIYAVTVKYHNEPKERLEARSAKDRKDLEYQLNMDDEVEWYDFDENQFNEGYSKEGYSWDEINGMIHIYEDGKLIDKYPDMESAEEAGWDLEGLVEDLDEECYNINEENENISLTFIETPEFKNSWKDLGLNDEDLR